ncbi:hypothetical protein [Actinomadura bangladeshensis]|uniref:Uncharacterized protein n=1 Tax=Actinomadura bangladeshensis TaxID=453573 RepID=A0A6L9QC56_9ACTN|nr:hypothetical protein [Actinomadura bangladeshensis]NEA22662.1 hypothetical protein [Actinomadura bangladeshensis]
MALPAQPPDAGDEDLDLITRIVDAIRSDRRRLRVVEDRQDEQAAQHDELRARVAGIEGTYDWYCVLAYAKMHGLRTDLMYLRRVGVRASALLRARGEEPGHRQDARFGKVNTYPEDVLRQAFDDVSA